MLVALRFGVLVTIKLLSQLFYRCSVEWVGTPPANPFQGVRLALLLNHTSLFEPLYFSVLPYGVLWDFATKGAIPGADITLNRPLAGRLYKIMAPDVVTITRKRDASWENFLSRIRKDSLILIAPEGRMKRPNGLDKEGKPMTVRGGIADLLQLLDKGRMVIAYSGGLHHVQTPGQWLPRVFKRLRIRLESLDIGEYKRGLGGFADEKEFKLAVIRDLEARRDRHCPG